MPGFLARSGSLTLASCTLGWLDRAGAPEHLRNAGIPQLDLKSTIRHEHVCRFCRSIYRCDYFVLGVDTKASPAGINTAGSSSQFARLATCTIASCNSAIN